ncbi:MAG: hypothetical protein CME06_07275 [Gemmatimonadetes bacterium]|nr:hypothetical protein [Gemmatimonadota bacterium]
MIVVTTNELPGRRIEEALGLVKGSTIRARHLGRDFMAGLKGIVGGEIEEYTKMIAEAREQAIDRMIEDARVLGADAVVCARFATTEVMRSAAEVVVYGTAVRSREE